MPGNNAGDEAGRLPGSRQFRNLVSVRLRILPYEAKTSAAPRRSATLPTDFYWWCYLDDDPGNRTTSLERERERERERVFL